MHPSGKHMGYPRRLLNDEARAFRVRREANAKSVPQNGSPLMTFGPIRAHDCGPESQSQVCFAAGATGFGASVLSGGAKA
jgi:hypothetical protein